MKHRKQPERPEVFFEQTYNKWRRELREHERHAARPDDYFEKTYQAWQREVRTGRRGRHPESDAEYWSLPLTVKLQRRYARRRWLLVLDMTALAAAVVFLGMLGLRGGMFREAGQIPTSMDEALDSPYTQELKREMEEERQELSERNRGL